MVNSRKKKKKKSGKMEKKNYASESRRIKKSHSGAE